ncbi:DUF2604 domain-containing protein [Pseudomonadota bacterium]
MSKNKVEIEIVVSGTAITLEATPNQTLQSLVAQALKKANEAGDPEQWGFFVEEGSEMVELDANIKVEDALTRAVTIYLNKKAGAAG